jgi:hypothetical protein
LCVRVSAVAPGVLATGISHSYRLLGDDMTSSPVVCAHVHGVHVVEASARRVDLNHLVTHDGVRWLWLLRRVLVGWRESW